MGSVALEILVIACCLALSFLLSGMEAGVLALSRFRVRWQMRSGIGRAQLLQEYLEDPENFLWTILVGNTLATFAAVSLLAVALFDGLAGHRWLFLGAFLVMVFLLYVFCDLLRKCCFASSRTAFVWRWLDLFAFFTWVCRHWWRY